MTTAFFHLVTYGLGVMSSHPETLATFGDSNADPEEAAALGVEMIIDSIRVR